MSSDTLNPSASVTIALQGLAVCCFNESFNDYRGRWEIAIPRFSDHRLSVEISGLGTFTIEPQVKFIEIKDRLSVRAQPRHEADGKIDRQHPEENSNDFRWVTNLSTDFGFEDISVITREQNPDRVDVTMLYVYDATAYTRSIDTSMLIRPALEATSPVVGGQPQKLPEATVVPILDGVEDFLFEAGTLGLDIESAGGDAVDLLFDRARDLAIPHGPKPQQIVIRNLELAAEKKKDRFIETETAHYGLGDFYRYYELFSVAGAKVHEWGKQPKGLSGPNRDCCCNKVTVKLASLNALL